MMFIETPRFPERIAIGAMGGPEFKTQIGVGWTGAEYRDGAWPYPRHSWDVSHGLNSEADYQVLRAFFMAARGKENSWRFKDWADYRAYHTGAYERGVFIGLTSTTFQMAKVYIAGSVTQLRRIRKPVAGTVGVKDSGADLTPTTHYTLDATTGIITTTSPRTAGNLTWAGEFDVPMRFDTDKLQGRVYGRTPADGVMQEWTSIPIVEDMRA